MATAAVLKTTELLEGILLCLDTRDLVVARRANRKFNEIIMNGSQAFKPTMFLAPVSGTPTIITYKETERPPDSNADLHQPYLAYRQSTKKFEPVIIVLNPIFSKCELLEAWRVGIELNIHASRLLQYAKTSGAGWEGMFLTQPPVRQITVCYVMTCLRRSSRLSKKRDMSGKVKWSKVRADTSIGERKETANLKDPDGVRIGSLVGLLRQLLKVTEESADRDTLQYNGPQPSPWNSRFLKLGSVTIVMEGVAVEGHPHVLDARAREEAEKQGLQFVSKVRCTELLEELSSPFSGASEEIWD